MPSDPTQRVIGAFIRSRRAALGLSQKALASSVKISAPYLSQIESGSRGISDPHLHKIASLLGFSPQEALKLKRNLNRHNPSDLRLSPIFEATGLELDLLLQHVDGDLSRLAAIDERFALLLDNLGCSYDAFLWELLKVSGLSEPRYFTGLERLAGATLSRMGGHEASPPDEALLIQTLGELGISVADASLPDPPSDGDRLPESYLDDRRGRLLIDRRVPARRRRFLIAREIAFQQREAPRRPLEYPRVGGVGSLGELRASVDATFLAAGLVMPGPWIFEELDKAFTASSSTFPVMHLRRLLDDPRCPSADVLMYRVTQYMAERLNLVPHLWVTRLAHFTDRSPAYLVEPLLCPLKGGLRRLEVSHHSCRRFASITLLSALNAAEGAESEPPIIIQKALRLVDQETTLTVAVLDRPPGQPPRILSLDVPYAGEAMRHMRFAQRDALRPREVGDTCETCSIYENCDERARNIYRPVQRPQGTGARWMEAARRAADAAADEQE